MVNVVICDDDKKLTKEYAKEIVAKLTDEFVYENWLLPAVEIQPDFFVGKNPAYCSQPEQRKEIQKKCKNIFNWKVLLNLTTRQ